MGDTRAHEPLAQQVTGKGVDVRVGEDRLVVEGNDGLLDVFLPLTLDNTATPTAHFVTSTRVSTLLLWKFIDV